MIKIIFFSVNKVYHAAGVHLPFIESSLWVSSISMIHNINTRGWRTCRTSTPYSESSHSLIFASLLTCSLCGFLLSNTLITLVETGFSKSLVNFSITHFLSDGLNLAAFLNFRNWEQIFEWFFGWLGFKFFSSWISDFTLLRLIFNAGEKNKFRFVIIESFDILSKS